MGTQPFVLHYFMSLPGIFRTLAFYRMYGHYTIQGLPEKRRRQDGPAAYPVALPLTVGKYRKYFRILQRHQHLFHDLLAIPDINTVGQRLKGSTDIYTAQCIDGSTRTICDRYDPMIRDA